MITLNCFLGEHSECREASSLMDCRIEGMATALGNDRSEEARSFVSFFEKNRVRLCCHLTLTMDSEVLYPLNFNEAL
jgi:hypothetical protein